MKTLVYDTLVVGSGCAGFNAIDWLTDLGVTEVALVTEGVKKGTSRNTGSDKQTYYKLSIAGNDSDSVLSMANTLNAGGEVDGPLALVEASCSSLCFMKLVLLGVDFPTDRYGQFVGYKTDHDPKQRATSAGPLTSRYMTEALEAKVQSKGIPILDGYQVVRLVVEEGKLRGLIAMYGGEPVYLKCNQAIWCTGGPSGIYRDVVYPESQRGMSGIVLSAGAEGNNLQHWQYGIASTKFRWNLSGTYQQVLPRYISIDAEGEEHEFLFEDGQEPSTVLSNIFLKGYQWPFDSRKIKGSSSIDLAVYKERVLKGRHVFLDFKHNSAYLPSDWTALGEEAFAYLKNSKALFGTPYERLEHMNPLAVQLYKEHGIYLDTQMLEIDVCAQHHNGGLLVDANWQSTIQNLYAAGEVAGTFGPYRPGGTALNSTQVGSMRAAQHIAEKQNREVAPRTVTEGELASLKDFENDFSLVLKGQGTSSCIALGSYFQKRMSEVASFIRVQDEAEKLLQELSSAIGSYFEMARLPKEYGKEYIFSVYDQLLSSQAILESMLVSAKTYGTYGSALSIHSSTELSRIEEVHKSEPNAFLHLVTVKTELGFSSTWRPVQPIPQEDTWFENVWAEHRRRKGAKI
ncbi:FAD-binding protein [uncultured Sphaerochaeta sp.]|uniref:FAD-binding protein n=1 Tax=uncultured Sphaerochaeta sp. TaxID=886478 RepID=UPI002A0A1CB8|nr:FAD-binding protein [uncultured Sphaerochaeta sp.]